MSRSNKRAKYLVLSSDSDSSIDDSSNTNGRHKIKNLEKNKKNSISTINNQNEQSYIYNEETMQTENEDDDVSEEEIYRDDTIVSNNLSTELVQTSIKNYLMEEKHRFDKINDLNMNGTNFSIRCKVIQKSSVRVFQNNNKVFDSIVCDESGEVKVVAFNEQVERLYGLFILNQTIIINDGNVKMANEKFRSAFSTYEILLLSNTVVRHYRSTTFNPVMRITKQSIADVLKALHGISIDVEGIVVMDRNTIISKSSGTGDLVRRKSIKIKDESSAINITFWNYKIDQIPNDIMNKKIRIRNGKINHYNDYVTINISDTSLIDFS